MASSESAKNLLAEAAGQILILMQEGDATKGDPSWDDPAWADEMYLAWEHIKWAIQCIEKAEEYSPT